MNIRTMRFLKSFQQSILGISLHFKLENMIAKQDFSDLYKPHLYSCAAVNACRKKINRRIGFISEFIKRLGSKTMTKYGKILHMFHSFYFTQIRRYNTKKYIVNMLCQKLFSVFHKLLKKRFAQMQAIIDMFLPFMYLHCKWTKRRRDRIRKWANRRCVICDRMIHIQQLEQSTNLKEFSNMLNNVNIINQNKQLNNDVRMKYICCRCFSALEKLRLSNIKKITFQNICRESYNF
jgi:hypothetical protein